LVKSTTGQVINVGSGCFVASNSSSAHGLLILTAAHVVRTAAFNATDDGEGLQIIVAPMTGMKTTDVPSWRYLAKAKPSLVNTKLDLAVLLVNGTQTVVTTPTKGIYSSKLTSAVSNDAISMSERDKSKGPSAASTSRRRSCVIKVGPTDTCTCPPQTASLDLGDASAMEYGQELSVFGFPRGCLDTLTHGRASCDGFATAPNKTGWIVKSRAGCSDGDSGGPVVTSDGKLVGVVSQSSSTLHGAIDYFRPVDLAMPLITKARELLVADERAEEGVEERKHRQQKVEKERGVCSSLVKEEMIREADAKADAKAAAFDSVEETVEERLSAHAIKLMRERGQISSAEYAKLVAADCRFRRLQLSAASAAGPAQVPASWFPLQEEVQGPEVEEEHSNDTQINGTRPAGPSANFAGRRFGFGCVGAVPHLLSHTPAAPLQLKPSSVSPVGQSVAEWRLRKASASSVDGALSARAKVSPPPRLPVVMINPQRKGGVPKKVPPSTPSPVGRHVLLWRQLRQQHELPRCATA
jgi:hypothetical protein